MRRRPYRSGCQSRLREVALSRILREALQCALQASACSRWLRVLALVAAILTPARARPFDPRRMLASRG